MLMGLIRLYQVGISPWLGNNCRFYPSCSCYTHEAIALHGPWRGLSLGLCRLAKCHPWHPGGVDLVPSTNASSINTPLIKEHPKQPPSSTRT